MSTEAEISSLEAELEFIQNEINRRHERIDAGVDKARNHEKIDKLRMKRGALQERLVRSKRPD